MTIDATTFDAILRLAVAGVIGYSLGQFLPALVYLVCLAIDRWRERQERRKRDAGKRD